MQRRQFLSCLGWGMGLGAATVAAPAVGSVTTRGAETDIRLPSPRRAAVAGKWPGHRPGMIYLGLSAAGSVDSVERIRALASHGVWAFTIGTAALDGVLLPGEPLQAQLELALEAAAD